MTLRLRKARRRFFRKVMATLVGGLIVGLVPFQNEIRRELEGRLPKLAVGVKAPICLEFSASVMTVPSEDDVVPAVRKLQRNYGQQLSFAPTIIWPLHVNDNDMLQYRILSGLFASQAAAEDHCRGLAASYPKCWPVRLPPALTSCLREVQHAAATLPPVR